MEPTHITHREQLSPTFTDSAIDMESFHLPSLPDRLSRLAHLASEDTTRLSEDDSDTLNRCLDTIESLLDPRPGLSKEISKCRPQSIHSEHTTEASCAAKSPADADEAVVDKADNRQLTSLLDQVAVLNFEMKQRREEAFHIYSLYDSKCELLSKNISELKSEIQELESDILEDSIEREGLRGTVHGLEGWIDGLQQLQSRAREMSEASLRNARKRWKVRLHEHSESDSDAILDGITAWMRGWKDIEDGFLIREQERRSRREHRRRQRNDRRSEVIDFGADFSEEALFQDRD